MRIEISAGGIGGISVADFQSDMQTYIVNAESVISSFKVVQNSTCNLNGGVGSLQGALDEIDQRVASEAAVQNRAQHVQSKAADFIQLAERIDKQVAVDVNQNKDELYRVNPWLRPNVSAEDTPWYEDAWNWLCDKGEQIADGLKKAWDWTKDTAKKAWDGLVEFYIENKKIIDTVLIVVGAIAAIAAVVFSGGTALVPLLGAIGVSASTATVISSAVAVLAVVSTVASSTLNVIDTWAEIDDPTFNAWQTGLNITSAVSNLVYSIGNIYNAAKGYKRFNSVDWEGYPDGAQRPTGYYRMLDGDEYNAARNVANSVNGKLHKMNPELSGMQIHEIHPVKFGGSPSDICNKLFLTPEEHAKFTVFWNNLMRGMR